MPKRKIIVGLHGLAEAGKTTAAQTLCPLLELRRFVIAQPIYQACAAALTMSEHAFRALPKSAYIETIGCTKREFLQHAGDCLLESNTRALIDLLELRIAMTETSPNLFNGELIEDVRTEAEADWVRSKGGIIVHIFNSRAHPAPSHRTEKQLKIRPLDLIVRNEGTLNEYQQHLVNIAQHIRAEFSHTKGGGLKKAS